MGGLMGRAALFTTAVEATEAALRRRVTLPMDLARYTSAGMQNSAIARMLRDPESKLAQGSDKGAGAGASSPLTTVFLWPGCSPLPQFPPEMRVVLLCEHLWRQVQ